MAPINRPARIQPIAMPATAPPLIPELELGIDAVLVADKEDSGDSTVKEAVIDETTSVVCFSVVGSGSRELVGVQEVAVVELP